MKSAARWVALVPGAVLAYVVVGAVVRVLSAPGYALRTFLGTFGDGSPIGPPPLHSLVTSDCFGVFAFAAAAGIIAPAGKRVAVIAFAVVAALLQVGLMAISYIALDDPVWLPLAAHGPPTVVAVVTAAIYRP